MSKTILLQKILGEVTATRAIAGQLDNRLTRVETQMTGVDERLSGVESRLTGVEARLHGVETRLGKVEILMTGNGRPENGVISRLERIEHWRGVVVWATIFIFTPVLAAGAAFVLSK